MQLKGFFFVFCAAVLWAGSGVASKFLFLGGMDSLTLTKFRLSLSTLTLFTIFLFRGLNQIRVKRGDLIHYVFLGFAMASVQYTYLFSISKINVATAILLQYMSPVLVVFYFLIFKGIIPEKKTLFSVGLAVIGCFYVVGAYNFEILSLNIAGITAGLLSAVFFATYSIKGESMMEKYSPETTIFYAFLFGCFFINVINPDTGFINTERIWTDWILIVLVSTLGTIAPFLFYFKGISIIGAVKANTTATLEPISAGLFSYIILGESMELLQISGAVMVICAVLILQRRKRVEQI